MFKSMQKFRSRIINGLVILLGITLGGCTISTPYRESSRLDLDSSGKEKVVLVSVTHITLNDDREARRIFWDHVHKLTKTMESNPGFRGMSLRRQLFGNEAWTLSVWENEESLREFVRSPEHRKAMNEGAPAARNIRFSRFQASTKELPLKWTEVLSRLDASAQNYGLNNAYGKE